MVRYTIKERPLKCPICGHDEFHWHEGLKESRASSFFGFDWAKEGVDKLTCADCSHTLSFARIDAPNRPKAVHQEPDSTGPPYL